MAEQGTRAADDGDDADRRRRRRRLAEVFGDVLPETTSDERGETGGDSEAWYRENRPPHHGG
ncbi:hypothetical protein ACVDFE_02670 [Lentzea chajnantorensis]